MRIKTGRSIFLAVLKKKTVIKECVQSGNIVGYDLFWMLEWFEIHKFVLLEPLNLIVDQALKHQIIQRCPKKCTQNTNSLVPSSVASLECNFEYA